MRGEKKTLAIFQCEQNHIVFMQVHLMIIGIGTSTALPHATLYNCVMNEPV